MKMRDQLEALHGWCTAACLKPHGWVTPAAVQARCGGPAICFHCFLEQIAPTVDKLFKRTRRSEQVAVELGDGVRLALDDYDSKLVLTDRHGVTLTVDREMLAMSLGRLADLSAAKHYRREIDAGNVTSLNANMHTGGRDFGQQGGG